MKNINLLITLFMLTAAVQAQNYRGKVADDKAEPVAFANIVLFSLPDSTFITGTTSDDNGNFEIEHNAPKGKYFVRVSCIGYKSTEVNCDKADLGTIVLKSDVSTLGEVEIVAKVPRTTFRSNALVTRIEGTVLEKAGDAYDVLNRLPLVEAKREKEEVKVLQKGNIEIYINGRLCRDIKELERIASDEIKEVEVITSPGAKYASTTGAVIRIKTKKPVGDGLGVDYTNRSDVTPETEAWSVNNNLGLNYRRKGLDIGANGNLYKNVIIEEDTKQTQRTHLQNLWYEESVKDAKAEMLSLNTQFYVNYQLNDSNSLGARYNFYRDPKILSTENTTSKLMKDNLPIEEGTSFSKYKAPSSSHYANFYYNGKIKEWEIAFNADLMLSRGKENTYAKEDFSSEMREIPMENRSSGNLYATKLDFTHPLWGGKISFGAEYAYTDNKNKLLDYSGLMSDYESQIKEDNVAAWVEYNRTFGKLSATAGLRYEHLSNNYYENGKKSGEQSRFYNDIFPTLSLSMPFGEVQTMLSYRAQISRPSYSMLSSGVYYGSRYSLSMGDPKLKATYEHNITFMSIYKWITLVVNYCDINDGIRTFTEELSEENPAIGISHFKQFDSEYLSTALSLAPSAIGIWTPQFDINFTYTWFDMPNFKNEKFDDPQLGISFDNTFTLPKNFIFNISANYSTEYDDGNLHWGELYSISGSLNKSFFNDKLNLRIGAWSPLGSNIKIYEISGNREFTQEIKHCANVGIRIRYKFNTAESKYKGTGAGSSQKSRMGSSRK